MKNKDKFSKKILQTEFFNINSSLTKTYIKCFNKINSTNTFAKNILSKNKPVFKNNGTFTSFAKKYHKSIFIAQTQTKGVGRLKREFISPSKTGIYFSLIYFISEENFKPEKITVAAAVAICRVLKTYSINAKIKWVNDIFVNNKKVCGILTESSFNCKSNKIDSIVIGIGLNLFDNSIFDENLKTTAGSIFGDKNLCNKDVTRAKLAAQIIDQTFKTIEESFSSILEEYKNASLLIEKNVKVFSVIDDNNSCYNAKVIDIDDNANLVVQLEDGSKKSLFSGEVSLHSDSQFI